MSFAELTLALERRATTRLRALADRRKARRAIRSGKNPKPVHLLTGERGEDAAFFHLRALGYTIVARRWRAERLRGDLDLVAWDGDTLVIFEIKTRSARDLAPAEAEVDHDKQQVLRRMAAAYLRQFPEPHRDSVAVRFDVLSVYLVPGSAKPVSCAAQPVPTQPVPTQPGEAEFEHFRNAFPPSALPPRRWR